MRFFIDEEKTFDIEGQLAELNEMLKKINSKAEIEKLTYGTALNITYSKTNIRNSGRKETNCGTIKLSVVRNMIQELGSENAARELGMTKQSMYRRIKKRENEGSKYF